MDDSNRVVSNGIEGAINYVERNRLSIITTKKFIELGEEEPIQTVDKGNLTNYYQTTHYLTLGGISSEVIKSLSLTLGIPTVTSTMGEEGDIK